MRQNSVKIGLFAFTLVCLLTAACEETDLMETQVVEPHEEQKIVSQPFFWWPEEVSTDPVNVIWLVAAKERPGIERLIEQWAEEADPIAYITKEGDSYHNTRDCSQLKKCTTCIMPIRKSLAEKCGYELCKSCEAQQ